MNASNAKDFLPLVQALADGKEIEERNSLTGKWETTRVLRTDMDPTWSRVKREPRLRPWKPEEVPVGAIVKSSCGSAKWLITCLIRGKVCLNGATEEQSYEPSHFIECKNTYSTDGGKTFHPCGVMEEA